MSETLISETSLLRLGKACHLLLNDTVAPDIVELCKHEKTDIANAHADKSLIRLVVYPQPKSASIKARVFRSLTYTEACHCLDRC